MRGKAITVTLIAGFVFVGLYRAAQTAIEQWSTTAGNNTSASPDGFPENMAPSGVNDSARELMAQVRRFAQQSVSAQFNHDTGSANTYSINPPIAPASYISGQVFRFKAGAANTGAATLNVSSLGAITIYKITNTTLAANDIRAGQVISVVYDGSAFQMQVAPALGALATLDTVAAAQISTNAITLAAIAQAPTGALITFGTDRNATYVTPGASGQVLTSRGNASTPVWQTTSSITSSAIAQAWASFSGNGAITIYDRYGVSAITRNNTGDYSVGFTTSMPNANYLSLCTQNDPSSVAGMESVRSATRWITGFRFSSYNSGGSATDYDGLNCLFLGAVP